MADECSVFVSRTADLAKFPDGRTFAQAAMDAVLKVGHRPVDMDYFSAQDSPAALLCRGRVRECDMYIGLIGLRYGSLVPAITDEVSYTEMEFLAASEVPARPRLLFLLDEDALVPARLVDHDRAAIEAFRGRLLATGLVVKTFRSADELETAVLHALTSMNKSRSASSASPVAGISPVWMVSAPAGRVTARPGLEQLLVNSLLTAVAGPAGRTTSVEGFGGFGKTTLVQMVCHQAPVRQSFPGGVLWTTIGEQTDTTALAGRLNSLCEVVSGERSTATDPAVAGSRLGRLLDGRPPTLLVIDDVWRPEQLEPFLIGGESCHRLVITRNRGVAPQGRSLAVDGMTVAEAGEALTIGVDALSATLREQLVRLTGRWPVLIGLVNGALAEHVQDGASVDQAARLLIEQLTAEGPAAFDDPDSRRHAVGATIAASLRFLDGPELERYLDLAIFPEDADIPADVLAMLWGTVSSFSPLAARRLRDKLVRLRLALGSWTQDQPALRLHDVIRTYLRHRVPPETQLLRHGALLAAASRTLPDPRGVEPIAWWTLPPAANYLWRYLVTHLTHSGQRDSAAALACDPRWVEAKIRAVGSAVGVEADLAMVSTPEAVALRRVLGQASHLLTPLESASGLGATLASRLAGVPGLERTAARCRQALAPPYLASRWPLPDRPHPALVRTLHGHHSSVYGSAFSPDGTLLASASDDGTVRIWNVVDGSPRAILRGHRDTAYLCVFSPDGTLLASASDDHTVRLWTVADGRPYATLAGHRGPVYSCSFSPNGRFVASGSQDRTVRIWNVADGSQCALLEGHTDNVFDCHFSPVDDQLLASVSDDRTVRLWDIEDRRERAVLTGHTDTVYSCFFSPDGSLLSSASDDRTVRLWNTNDGTPNSVLAGHTDTVYSCAISPDGQLLASGSDDQSVRLWNVSDGSLLAILDGHTDSVYTVIFSPDGRLLSSTSDDRTVRLWDVTDRQTHAPLVGQTKPAYNCSFSPGGDLLATTSSDQTVRLWDVPGQRLITALHGHSNTVYGCRFSPDGGLLASASDDCTVRLWDVARRRVHTVFDGHTGPVYGCTFSPDGLLLASTSDDRTVRLWSVSRPPRGRTMRRDNRAHMVLRGHTELVYCCKFSPNGALLASASADRTVRIWGVADGRTHLVLEGHSNTVYAAVFSPDGRALASTSEDQTIRLWDVATGQLLSILQGHTGPVYECSFSPDGTQLATGSADRTVRIWDIEGGQCVAAIRVADSVFGCVWHPRTSIIAATGICGTYVFDYVA